MAPVSESRAGHTPGPGVVSRPLSSLLSPCPLQPPWCGPSTPSCSQSFCPSRAPTRGGEPGRGRGGGTRRDGAAARGVPGRAKFQRQRQRGGDSLLLSSPALTTILLVQEMTWKTEESGVWGRRGPPNSGGRSRASLSPASPEPAPRGSSRVPAARPTGRATLRRRSGLRQLCAWDTFWGSC